MSEIESNNNKSEADQDTQNVQKAIPTDSQDKNTSVDQPKTKKKGKILKGIVSSDKPDKTIIVKIEYQKKDRHFKKTLRKSKKIMAHDEKNKAKQGNLVKIQESRPISKNKYFELIEIVS